MSEDFWIIIGVSTIIPLVVLFPFALISQKRLQAKLKENNKFNEEYEVDKLEGNIGFVIPFGLLFFLCSIVGLAQKVQFLDKLLPNYLPRLGFNFSIFLLLASLGIIGYSYWSMKNMFTSWKAMLWLIIWGGMIVIAIGLNQFWEIR